MFSAIDRSLSNSFCEVLVISTGVAAYACFAMSNWILLARAKALLGSHRILKYFLLALYIILYLGTAGMVIKISRDLKGHIFYSKTVRSCGVANRPLDMGSKLLMVLYRDGVCYYVIIIGLRIFTFTSWIAFPISLLFITFFVLWAVMSIAITRLQINLRKAVDLEPPLDDVQTTPPPESRRDETSVILIWGKNRRGIYTLTSDIQLRSMTSTHHRALSDYDSHHVNGARSTFQDEGEYGRGEESELPRHLPPNESIAVTRSTTRAVPIGPRVLETMIGGVPIATDHSRSGSFQRNHDSAV
ncbi:hypothetical protein CPB86DRAFT_423784 [Serendipita vermifera]|nr:hypothetical protein CPB86DRAFT_423784 [Serendipita vermifera]